MSDSKINWDALVFRRQYILTSIEAYECPFIHESYPIGDKYTLYVHKDLVLCKIEHNGKLIFLLGDIYSFENPGLSNSDILQSIAGLTFDELLTKTSKYTGRFLIIFYAENEIKLFHDACASRKIYYIQKNNSVHCSSNPHLLASTMGLSQSQDESVLNYYKSDAFKKNIFANIGDKTPFDEILQLLPNHFIKIEPSLVIERYLPHKIESGKTDKEIVAESARMIKGFLEAASHRYPLMIPITAGYDSRLLLAASKDIQERVFYYLNVKKNAVKSSDAKLHKKILTRFGIKYNLLIIDDSYPNDFKKICFRNNPYVGEKFFGVFYNYLINFPNHLNIPGTIIPIVKIRNKLGNNKDFSAKSIASHYNFENYSFAVRFYSDWIEKYEKKQMDYKVDSFDLLYWESSIPNRDLQIQQDKDIAQEEFVVFNSSYLLTLMLAYSKKNRMKPYLRLHKEIIQELWPELLNFPFNSSLKKNLFEFLIKINLYEPLLKIKRSLKSII